jgi:hypothetical protein
LLLSEGPATQLENLFVALMAKVFFSMSMRERSREEDFRRWGKHSKHAKLKAHFGLLECVKMRFPLFSRM